MPRSYFDLELQAIAKAEFGKVRTVSTATAPLHRCAQFNRVQVHQGRVP